MTDQRLTRPIMGLENRTPQEVFNIMCDRIRHAQTATDMATPADIAAAARRMDAYAAQDAKPDGNAQSEAVAYIQAAALSELLRHKQATTTVCSGLLKAHPDAIPLYTHPAPPLAVTDEMVERAAIEMADIEETTVGKLMRIHARAILEAALTASLEAKQ